MIVIKYSLRQYVIRLSLNIILLMTFFFVLLNSTLSTLIVLPNGNSYASENTATVNFHDLFVAQNQLNSVQLNGIAKDSAVVSGTVDANMFEEVNLVYTDEKFVDTHQLRLQQGVFFSTMKSQFNTTDVLISSDLAFHLFLSLENIVGRQVYVNEQKLTVVGVYYSDSSLINRLSGNGFDTIFVPYYSVLTDGMLMAKEIVVAEQTGEQFLSIVSEAETNDELNGKLNFYQKTEFGVEKRLLWQGFQFLMLAAAVILCIYLVVLLQYDVRKSIVWGKEIRTERRTVSWREITLKLIWPVVFIGVIVALLILFSFELYLPFRLESSNVFDLGFYVNYFVERFLLLRGAEVYFYGNYIILTTLIQAISGLLLLVFEVNSLRWLHRVIKLKTKLS